jgi:hypothetical protein
LNVNIGWGEAPPVNRLGMFRAVSIGENNDNTEERH